MKKIIAIISLILLFSFKANAGVTYSYSDFALEDGSHLVVVKITIDSATINFTPYNSAFTTFFFDASSFQKDSTYYIGVKHKAGATTDSLRRIFLYGSNGLFAGSEGMYPTVVDTITGKDTTYIQLAHTARSQALFMKYWAIGFDNILRLSTSGFGTWYIYIFNRAWAKHATVSVW